MYFFLSQSWLFSPQFSFSKIPPKQSPSLTLFFTSLVLQVSHYITFKNFLCPFGCFCCVYYCPQNCPSLYLFSLKYFPVSFLVPILFEIFSCSFSCPIHLHKNTCILISARLTARSCCCILNRFLPVVFREMLEVLPRCHFVF